MKKLVFSSMVVLLIAQGCAIDSDENVNGQDPVGTDNRKSGVEGAELVSKWQIAGEDNRIILPLPAGQGYQYDFHVDWGDGTVSNHNSAEAVHVYEKPGIYTVKISGLVEAWSFSHVPHSKDNIVAIDNLGGVGLKSMHGAFSRCKNLTVVAGGDTSEVITMRAAFEEARSATPDINGWDTSQVVDMAGMFIKAVSADPDVSAWDTSAVVNMNSMFRGALAAKPLVGDWNIGQVVDLNSMFMDALSADPDVSDWDTSNVVDMSNMFRGAISANPDVSDWDVGKVVTMDFMFAEAVSAEPQVDKWNTGNVTTMRGMFTRATSANPAVGDWDTARVTNTAGMFLDAISANPRVSCWDTGNIVDMRYMFSGAVNAQPYMEKWNFANAVFMHKMFDGVTLNARNYSKLLTQLVATSPRKNLIIDVGNSIGDDSSAEARATLEERGWVILDGRQTGHSSPDDSETTGDSNTPDSPPSEGNDDNTPETPPSDGNDGSTPETPPSDGNDDNTPETPPGDGGAGSNGVN